MYVFLEQEFSRIFLQHLGGTLPWLIPFQRKQLLIEKMEKAIFPRNDARKILFLFTKIPSVNKTNWVLHFLLFFPLWGNINS